MNIDLNTFNTVAGLASIIGLILTIWGVKTIIKKITKKNSNNNQSLKIKGKNTGNVNQVIGDGNDIRG